ncbi:MAG: hypothetical protein AAGJ19_22330 [Myxococcota bacterium]
MASWLQQSLLDCRGVLRGHSPLVPGLNELNLQSDTDADGIGDVMPNHDDIAGIIQVNDYVADHASVAGYLRGFFR